MCDVTLELRVTIFCDLVSDSDESLLSRSKPLTYLVVFQHHLIYIRKRISLTSEVERQHANDSLQSY